MEISCQELYARIDQLREQMKEAIVSRDRKKYRELAYELAELRKQEPKINQDLYQAVINYDLKKVEELISSGTSVFGKAENGQPIIDLVIDSKHVEMAEALLNAGARLGPSSLYKVVSPHPGDKIDPEILRLVIQAGADVNWQLDGEGCTPLHYAVGPQGSLDIVKILIESGADPNMVDSTGKVCLNYVQDEEIFEYLYPFVSNTFRKEATDRFFEIRQEQARLDSRDKDVEMFLDASFKGENEIISRFVDQQGIDVNSIGYGGYGALFISSKWGRFQVVQKLLRSGADVDIRDRDNKTPLIGAFEFLGTVKQNPQHYDTNVATLEETIYLLVEYGADVNAADNYGWTPLFGAVNASHVKMVDMLIHSGVNVNATDINNDSPLIRAVRLDDQVEIIKLLTEAGACLNTTNASGESALHIAKRKGNREILKLLGETS